jgi:hypothetical protein
MRLLERAYPGIKCDWRSLGGRRDSRSCSGAVCEVKIVSAESHARGKVNVKCIADSQQRIIRIMQSQAKIGSFRANNDQGSTARWSVKADKQDKTRQDKSLPPSPQSCGGALPLCPCPRLLALTNLGIWCVTCQSQCSQIRLV